MAAKRRQKELIPERTADVEASGAAPARRWARAGAVAVGAGLVLARLGGVAGAAEHPFGHDDGATLTYDPGHDGGWQSVDDKGRGGSGSSGSGSSGSGRSGGDDRGQARTAPAPAAPPPAPPSNPGP